MQAALNAERLNQLKKENDWVVERGILAGKCFSKVHYTVTSMSVYTIYIRALTFEHLKRR
jgi:hypothetical protein